MTDKEVIKALKVCAKNETPFCCGECELGENNSSCDCVDRLLKLSLDLINRQQAEIDMLNAENTLAISERNAFQKSFYATVKENRQLKADLKEIGIEYERLDDEVTNGIEVCHECHEKYDKKIKQTKAEAIKEYMKILEEKLSQNTDISNVGYQSIIFDMEQGYKEMVGEGK